MCLFDYFLPPPQKKQKKQQQQQQQQQKWYSSHALVKLKTIEAKKANARDSQLSVTEHENHEQIMTVAGDVHK